MDFGHLLRPRYARLLSASVIAICCVAGCNGLPSGEGRDTEYSTIDDGAEPPFALNARQLAVQAWSFAVEPVTDVDPAAAPYEYLWDFGDGTTTAGGTTQEHEYAAEGEYDVQVAARQGDTIAFVLRARAVVQRIRPTVELEVLAGPDEHAPTGEEVCLEALGLIDWTAPGLEVAWVQVSGPAVVLQRDEEDFRRACFSAPPVSSATALGFQVVVMLDVNSDSDDVTITVDPKLNTATLLEANAGPDQSAEGGATVALSGSAVTNGNADDVVYAWSQASGSAVSLGNANSAQASFVAPELSAPETLVFRLQVQLGDAVAIDEVNVTVAATENDDGGDTGTDGLGGGGGGGGPEDLCPEDPDKLEPGLCGCGVPDTDTDADQAPDCLDECAGSDDRLDADSDGTPDGCDPAMLRVSATALDFGGGATTLSFDVWNAGIAPLSYTVTSQAAWVSESPASGSSSGEHDRIDVTINRAGLPAGANEAQIVVRPAVGAAITLTVSALVAAATADTMTTASRTTGVAPLAVFFDAITPANGVVQPSGGDYPTQHYAWNFGDNAAATWKTTNRSRNTAFGYVAGHVFEQPGTYNVQLAVTDASGVKHAYTQAITVTDPATATGWTTYYVAANGNDSNDGKSTAQPFKTFAQAMTKATAKSRILFRRGDSFAVTTGKSLTSGPGIIGAYGDPVAAAPVLDAPSVSFVFRLQTPDWRLTDMKIVGGSVTDSAAVDGGSAACLQMLALRLEIAGFYVGIINTYFPQPIVHDHNFIVDCDLHGQANKAVFIGGTRTAVLGNAMHETASHILRIWHAEKFVVSENNLLDPLDPVGAVIKLHNATEVPNLPDGRHIIISGNRIRGHTWAVTIGTQGGWANETVRDVVIERNFFQAGPSTRISCRISAQNVLARNNIGDLTGAPDSSHLLSVTRWGAEPPPTGARLFNNSVYRGDAGTAQLLEVPWSDTIGYNNLAWAPAGTPVMGASGANFANNLVVDPKWQNPSAGDFHLKTGSPAIGAGRSAIVFDDYTGAARNGAMDAGAFEFAP